MINSDSKMSQSQLSAEFMQKFNATKDDIFQRISQLEAGSTVTENLTEVSSEIQKLSKALHDAVMFLPAYSVKIRQNEIRDLEKRLKEKGDVLIPKKRFGFKSKAPPPSSNNNVPLQPTSDTVPPEYTTNKTMVDNYFTIGNINGEVVRYNEEQLNGNDVLVKDSEDAVFILEGGPSTLRLANLKNCKFICGPVRTSIFIDNVRNSILFLCCQQLRTHSSEEIDIYLRVGSRAIIEDCTKVRFGPYEWSHEKSEELHSKAEINISLERYDAVDDFNWLSSSPSPNWTTIPSTERIVFNFG